MLACMWSAKKGEGAGGNHDEASLRVGECLIELHGVNDQFHWRCAVGSRPTCNTSETRSKTRSETSGYSIMMNARKKTRRNKAFQTYFSKNLMCIERELKFDCFSPRCSG